MNKLMISVLLCSFITSAWAGTAYITEPASKITAGSTQLTSGSGTTILEDMSFTLASSHSSPKKWGLVEVEVDLDAYSIPFLNTGYSQKICPALCKDAGGIWRGRTNNKYRNGHRESFCGCHFPTYRPPTTKSVDVKSTKFLAGNQHGAQNVCPYACKSEGKGPWNGQWNNKNEYTRTGPSLYTHSLYTVCGCYEE